MSKRPIAEELQKGNPKRWLKKNLARVLFRKFLFSIIMMILIPTIWGVFVLIFAGRTDRKTKYPPNEFSASYGINDTKGFQVSFAFRFIYSASCLLLAAAIDFIIYYFCIDALGFLYFTFCAIPALWVAIWQIVAVCTVKKQIGAFTCNKCGYANTIREGEAVNKEEKDEERFVVKAGGGESYEAAKIKDADGNTVGSIHARTPSKGIYHKYRITTWDQQYYCAHCGNTFIRARKSEGKVGGYYKA